MIYNYQCKNYNNKDGGIYAVGCSLDSTSFCKICYRGVVRICWTQLIIKRQTLIDEGFNFIGLL